MKFPAVMITFFIASTAYAGPASQMETFLKDLQTFRAAFKQQLLNEYDEVLEESVGVFYLRRPGMWHWAYWQPYAQQIISDGKTLWVYDEDLEQVTVRDVPESMGNTPAAILSGETDLKAHYVMIALPPEGEMSWLELTPRDIDSEYSAVRLGFHAQSLGAMILFDNLGQKTRIDFIKPQRNPKLGREQFQFSSPEGIDVIDNRQP